MKNIYAIFIIKTMFNFLIRNNINNNLINQWQAHPTQVVKVDFMIKAIHHKFVRRSNQKEKPK